VQEAADEALAFAAFHLGGGVRVQLFDMLPGDAFMAVDDPLPGEDLVFGKRHQGGGLLDSCPGLRLVIDQVGRQKSQRHLVADLGLTFVQLLTDTQLFGDLLPELQKPEEELAVFEHLQAAMPDRKSGRKRPKGTALNVQDADGEAFAEQFFDRRRDSAELIRPLALLGPALSGGGAGHQVEDILLGKNDPALLKDPAHLIGRHRAVAQNHARALHEHPQMFKLRILDRIHTVKNRRHLSPGFFQVRFIFLMTLVDREGERSNYFRADVDPPFAHI